MSTVKASLTVKRLIWALVLLAVCAYFLNSYLENRAKKKAEREKAQKIERSIRSAVNEMVSRFDAVTDWEQRLSKGETVRTEKILTIELERLWLGKRPILFIGFIEDISTIDERTYRLRIERGLFSSFKYMWLTELGLELRCSKSMLDQFLEAHPKLFSNFGLKNGVAVIAKVDQIKTLFYTGEKGNKEEMRVGLGRCLDITYTGSVQF
ncbi:MAG: hypothetical protein JRI58_12995 [Deltaproteobacteria bacterium]|nr:hypothetical protein [Deltaproteobacteria bacterium]